MLRGIAKVLVGGVATAAAAYGTSKVLGNLVDTHSVAGQLVQVTGSVVVGLLVFVTAALLLRMEDLQLVKEFVVARVRPGTHARP